MQHRVVQRAAGQLVMTQHSEHSSKAAARWIAHVRILARKYVLSDRPYLRTQADRASQADRAPRDHYGVRC